MNRLKSYSRGHCHLIGFILATYLLWTWLYSEQTRLFLLKQQESSTESTGSAFPSSSWMVRTHLWQWSSGMCVTSCETMNTLTALCIAIKALWQHCLDTNYRASRLRKMGPNALLLRYIGRPASQLWVWSISDCLFNKYSCCRVLNRWRPDPCWIQKSSGHLHSAF